MAQFDLKKATIKLCDGRQATLTTTAGVGVNGEIVLTDASKHRGSRPAVTITIVNAGVSHLTLDVAVSGTDITVTPITDGGGVITSTATAVAAAIAAFPAAAALVSVAQAGSGASPVVAQVKTSLANGPRTMTIKLYEGTMSYDEKHERVYVKDRGLLSSVRDGDQMPVEVKFDTIWEFITASSGSGTPTPEDCLKNRGEAAAWVTTDEDTCSPYCVDVEVLYNPACSPTQREWITLPYFRFEDLGHNLKDGALSFAGKCNVIEASAVRIT